MDHLAERIGDGPEVAAAAAFVRLYYDSVAPDDVLAASRDDLLAAALSLWKLGAERRPGTAKVRVFNPTPEADGWKCAHSVAELVNDDMPFLVSSTTGALNRRGRTIHLVAHPVLPVVRDGGGRRRTPVESAPPIPAGGGASGPATAGLAESYIHVEFDQETSPEELAEMSGELEVVLADVRAAVSDWPAMRAKVEAIATDLDRNPPPVPPGRARGGDRLPPLAGRRPLRLRRLPRVRPGRGGRRRLPALRSGRRPRRPAHGQAGHRRAREAAAASGGRRPRPAAGAAVRHQGLRPRHRPPPGPPRLRRRAPLRRRRTGGGRAALRRAVHLRGVRRQRAAPPAAAPQDRGGARSRRLRARQPRRPGARPHPRDPPPRRTVPDRRRRAVRPRPGHPPPPGAPAPGAVRAPRPVRPLRLLSGLRPPRPLLDRAARTDDGDPRRGVRRRGARLRRRRRRLAAGADAVRHPRLPRRTARLRRQGDRSALGRRRPHLGRPAARGAGRTRRRGAGAGAVPALPGGVPGRLPRRLRPPRRRSTTPSASRRCSPAGRRRPLSARISTGPPAARRTRSTSSSTGSAPRGRSPTSCRCSRTWASG